MRLVDDLDRHSAIQSPSNMSPRVPRRFQNSFRFIRMWTSELVRAIAVNGRKSGASTIVTPCRNGASRTLIGVPKTVSPAGCAGSPGPRSQARS